MDDPARNRPSEAASAIGRRALLAGLLSLGGCAQALHPAAYSATRSVAEPELRAQSFIAEDGARLPMKVWRAVDASGVATKPWAVVLGLHGFNDTAAESFILAGPAWARMGVATYAFDQRGFGRAPGRGMWAGEKAMADDVRTACRLLRQRHPDAILAVAGESMGGAVAISAFGADNAPDADRLILLSPAVWGWDQQAPLNAVTLRLLARLAPGLAVSLPSWIVDDDDCTDNQALIRRMDRDPDEINASRMDVTCGLVDLMQSAESKLCRVKVDTVYMYGAHDTVIPKRAAFKAAATLSPTHRTAYYPDGWHLLDRDLHSKRVLTDVADFIRDPKSPLGSSPPCIPAATTVA